MKTTTLLSALAVTASLLLPSQASAQTAHPWEVRLVADGGIMVPLRELGKTRHAEGPDQQFTFKADLDPAAVVQAAVEVTTPYAPARIRLAARTTLGATAEGQIAECILADDDAGEICNTSETDARVSDVTLGLVLIRRPVADRPLRPYLAGGAGLRFYEFAESGCTDFPCAPFERILTDQTTAAFEATLGVRYDTGPIVVDVHASNVFSGYESDSTNSDGSSDVQSEVQSGLLFGAGVVLSLF